MPGACAFASADTGEYDYSFSCLTQTKRNASESLTACQKGPSHSGWPFLAHFFKSKGFESCPKAPVGLSSTSSKTGRYFYQISPSHTRGNLMQANPLRRATSSRTAYRSRRHFLFQSQRRLSFTPSLLLSKSKPHGRFVPRRQLRHSAVLGFDFV